MNQKGFTLIELLSVIVILGIISLITTPIVMGTMEKSRKKSFEMTTKKLIEAIENYVLNYKIETGMSIRNKEIKINNHKIEEINIDVNGEIPENGTIYIDENGKITLAIYNGGLCAIKLNYDDPIEINDRELSECKLDRN